MPNILNQDEIDSLLGAMERGEIDEVEKKDSSDITINDYNFRRPNLITKDQLRNFETIHENFAREMLSALALFMRTNVEFNLVSTEQQQYAEFVNSLSNISHSIVFSAEPLPGFAVIEINLSLVFGIIDMLLGGQGDVETEIRIPTDIEISIMGPFIERLMEQLQTCWNSMMDVKLKNERNESDPEYIQAAPSDAPVVVLAFDVKVGFANGIINICYPMPMIQGVNEHLDRVGDQMDSYYGRKADGNTRQLVMNSLMEVPMPMSAILGEARIRSRDLVTLQKGDIVVLDTELSDYVALNIAGRNIFKGRPGRINRQLYIKLAERFSLTGGDTPEFDFN